MRTKHDQYTKDEILAILHSAGITVSMLPRKGTRPNGYGSGMPEHLIEFSDLIGAPKKNKLTVRATQDQMSELEIVFDWMGDLSKYCRENRMPYIARAFAYGFQRYPDSGKKIYNWAKLGRKMNTTGITAKRWYLEAIEIMIRNLHEKNKIKFE